MATDNMNMKDDLFLKQPKKSEDSSKRISVLDLGVTYLVDVSHGFIISHHHLSELCTLLWVDSHYIPQ